MLKDAFGVLKVIILTLLFSVLFVLAVKSIIMALWGRDVTVESDWVASVGILVETNYGGEGGAAKFSYEVNSTEYEEYSGAEICLRGEGYVAGERYRIKVNPKNPREFKVLIWAPVFATNEKTAQTVGTIKDLYKPNISIWGLLDDTVSSVYSIRFKFCPYNWNRALLRSQDMAPNFRKEYPDIKEGQQYVVEYLLKDPRRAVIYFNKRVR